MTFILLSTLYIAFAAALWRFRGGGIHATGSTQLARAVCASLLVCPIAFMAGNLWLFLLAPALFVGMVIIGWGDFMDMGRTSPKSEELVSPLVRWLGPASVTHDVVGMSLSGAVLLTPATIVLAFLTPYAGLLMLAGALFGPIYWVGWKLSPVSGTETAEWIVGAAVGAALLALTTV